jgi:EAL domain-containing protein (putative c-di-GMP-specific phosphodiesterase class I)
MPTSLHLPRRLVDEIDRRAQRLGISRNRLIVGILDRELGRESQWSSGFLERLADVGPDEAAAVDDLGP